ncbi:uroporphyrinogen-III synthase [Fluviicola taffensis]|uniref:Uroporphyrinogen III synthase HEM4 n=1 Tax=Fluviicola taffensis (strain DSM 16823 / NCIMB 13979 / RW262) TaxID=755732 RepID=F2IEC6_FLUTR|nr:uroporphyrinogen-III synthase [Fluviicola taffensis]AEA43450.1 Uroporphyrinogen III synthase HEM4 [Fluviicola taffensis DSM 16823]
MTRIFLSSESNSSLPVVQFCTENNIQLIRRSLISFKAIDFSLPSEWDVVFFSSPRSFDFFCKRGLHLEENQQIACIGNETKNQIEKAGFSVSFVGQEAGKPSEVGIAFKEWLGKRIALFPQSNKSNKSVEKSISESLRIPLLVYETVNSSSKIDWCSVYIFTSPSNLTSFLLENKIPKNAIIIAWGETTNELMLSLGYQSTLVLNTSSYHELIEILPTLIA